MHARWALAPLRWWMTHPWAVLWLAILAGMLVATNTELAFRRSRFLAGFVFLAMVVVYVSFAQGLRATWHKSRTRACLIAGGLALHSLVPLLVLLLTPGGVDAPMLAVAQFVILFPLVVGGAVDLEYAARTRPLRGLLGAGTAHRATLESAGEDRTATVDPDTSAPGRAGRLLRRAALPVGILLALVVVLVVYPAWKIGDARARAEALCAAAVVGGPAVGLKAKGEDLGLAVHSLPARIEPGGAASAATITGWSGWIFARWFCTIEHADGKVLGKRTYFLD